METKTTPAMKTFSGSETFVRDFGPGGDRRKNSRLRKISTALLLVTRVVRHGLNRVETFQDGDRQERTKTVIADSSHPSFLHGLEVPEAWRDASFFIPEIESPSTLGYAIRKKKEESHQHVPYSSIKLTTLARYSWEMFWVPIVVMAVWLNMPLMQDSSLECQSFYLFAALHQGLYFIPTNILIGKISGICMPVPHFNLELGLSFISAAVGIAADILIFNLTNNLYYLLPVPIVLQSSVHLVFHFIYAYRVFKTGLVIRKSKIKDGPFSPRAALKSLSNRVAPEAPTRKEPELVSISPTPMATFFTFVDELDESVGPMGPTSTALLHDNLNTKVDVQKSPTFRKPRPRIVVEYITEKDMRNFFGICFFFTLLASMVLIIFYFCQAFTRFYLNIDSTADNYESQQVLFGTLFPWLLTPLFGLMSSFSRQIDIRLKRWEETHRPKSREPKGCAKHNLQYSPRTWPIPKWANQLFVQLYTRSLFTSISDVPTLMQVLAISIALDVGVFLVRMSPLFFQAKRFIFEKLGKTGEIIVHIVGEDLDDDLEQYQKELATDFFLSCIAQRFSVITYIVNVTILRYNHSRHFYPYAEDDSYPQLMQFVAIMFVLEWVGSIFIWALMKTIYHIEAIKVGAGELLSSGTISTLTFTSIHVSMDVYLALNKFNFRC